MKRYLGTSICSLTDDKFIPRGIGDIYFPFTFQTTVAKYIQKEKCYDRVAFSK
jgi:hypothetical protein